MVVDYLHQGKRKLKTFDLKKDAEAWAVTMRHEISIGTHASDTKTTVGEAIELWISHGARRRFGTLYYRATPATSETAYCATHRPGEIGRADDAESNALLDQLRDAGRSVAMRRKILRLRRCPFVRKGRGLVAQNVALGVRVRSDDRHKATGPLKAGRDFPTKEELNLLMDRAPERWRPFIVTAIFTGMRASELRGLRW